MKRFAALLRVNAQSMFASSTGIVFFTILSLLFGIGNYLSLSAASSSGDSPAYLWKAFLYPLLWAAFLVPAVVAGMISRYRDYSAEAVLGILAGSGKLFAARITAAALFVVACAALAMPGLWFGLLCGMRIPVSSFLSIAAGSLLFLGEAVSVTSAIAVHCKNANRGIALSSISFFLFCAADGVAAWCGFSLPLWMAPLRAVRICASGAVEPTALVSLAGPSIALSAVAWAGMISHKQKRTNLRRAVAVCSILMAVVASMPSFIAHRNGAITHSPEESAVTLENLGVWAQADGSSSKQLVEDSPKGASLHGARNDILLFYGAAVPLLMFFFPAARFVRNSRMSEYGKSLILIGAVFLTTIGMLAVVQHVFFARVDVRWFPSLIELAPQRLFRIPFLEQGRENTAETLRADRSAHLLYAGKNNRNLARFFNKCADLKAGRRRKVRIVHYGDSLIWGDCFSRAMKRMFQNEFGDGGRGIVPAAPTLATTLQDYASRIEEGRFAQHSIMHVFRYGGRFREKPAENKHVGFTGEGAFLARRKAKIHFETPKGGRPIERVTLFLRSPSDAVRAVNCGIAVDCGQGTMNRRVSVPAGGFVHPDLSLPRCDAFDLTLRCDDAPLPSLDAVNLESGEGIVYSAIVRMGIHMAWMNAIPETNLRAINSAAPDLLIFQFGVNEAASRRGYPEFSAGMLRMQMREWFERIRRAAPEADVLVIGPPERLVPEGGTLVPMRETLEVREIQKEEALRAGFAFFDTCEALGGEGHMIRLVQSGMAMNDYTHFSMRGGDYAAGIVYAALLKAMNGKNDMPRLDEAGKEQKGIMTNSPSYVLFLAAVVFALALAGKKPWRRHFILLVASLLFYATFAVWPVLCLLATIVVDFTMGYLINRARSRGGRGTLFLAISLTADLGILFVLKYFNFFTDIAGHVMSLAGWRVSLPVFHVALPVGISFYTFQSLSYTIDIWRGAIEPERRPITYGHYVSMFTQILAGPIAKAKEFLPQITCVGTHFRITRDHVAAAVFLIMIGLLKKGAADWLAGSLVDRVYASPRMFFPLETLAAVYAYGIQIYADFSGYTDIALGSAMLLGYRLPENFNRPYASASVSEFWQRWHMSLGAWLREYVYISLGGNRKRVYVNIFLTMLICGLWHGAALTFVAWGIYHGLFMVIERAMGMNRAVARNRPARVLRIALTLHIVLFGWIIFRCDSWNTFTEILRSFTGRWGPSPNLSVSVILLLAAFYAAHYTPVEWKRKVMTLWRGLSAEAQGVAAAVVAVILYHIASPQASPFIYFKF